MSTEKKLPPTELEVKFQLPEGVEAAVATHRILRAATRKPPRQEVTTYFDTPDHRLAQAGASLRVRRADGRCVQTLKLRGGNGPFARNEWEWPVHGEKPDPGHLAETPLAPALDGAPELTPLFTTEVTRSIRTVRRDGALVEVTTDVGSIRAGDAQEPIREMELELKSGQPLALFRLAEALQADLPLVLGTEAKSERGWRLLTGQPRKVEKQGDIELPPDVTAADAFRRISGATLSSLLANQPAAAAGRMDGVHQLRIAIRRLRACLDLFRPHLDQTREEHFTEAMRQLGRILGEARDWDVFCAETLPEFITPAMPEPLLARLRAVAEAERSAAHAKLAEEFARPSLSRLVLGLAAWAEDPVAMSGTPDGGAMTEPLTRLAPKLEERLARRVRKRGRRIRHRSDEELHGLRKALKKLRYGVEFLEPLHRQKQADAFLRRCKALQEQLGALNDAAVAITLAERLSGQDSALAPVTEAMRGWAAKRRSEALEDLPKSWRRFKHADLPDLNGN